MNTQNKISLQYQLTKKDYIEANQTIAFKSSDLLNKWLYPFGMITVGFLEFKRIQEPNFMTIQFTNNYNYYQDPSEHILWALIYIGFGIYFLLCYSFPKYNILIRWKLSRSYQNNFVKQELRNVEINNSQVKIVLDSYREVHNWQSYLKFIESSTMFLLYSDNDKKYQIIPKRAFKSELDINSFRSLLEAKISK